MPLLVDQMDWRTREQLPLVYLQARSRDVSFQTRSESGTKIKDTFMTINQTAKKLGVSFYAYVYDRVAGQYKLPSLADLIMQKAQVLA